MADHSQKWHDGSPSRSICGSNNSKGVATIASKLDNLGPDMKKLKENVHNQLPPKEEDLGSFILPCSIGRLDFNNALADLGASINIMPFSMYKHLGMGKLEPIRVSALSRRLYLLLAEGNPPKQNQHWKEHGRWNIVAEESYKEEDTNKEKFEEYETVEQCLNPAEKRAYWCKALSQEKGGLRKYWASCDTHNDICDGGGLPNNVERLYWESTNDNE
ncbi:hypothetical protein Tco_1040897 [Tanacetum coccineum]|uniref:Uncharacterized protein n=1 Tax=Tanacetum coccineum TaxID=301880 RepID=A0ABQ5GGU4_9ASTR